MKKIILAVTMVVTITSCTASLYPIVEETNVVYAREILGKWKDDGTVFQVEQYLASKNRSVPFGESDSLLNPVTAEQRRANIFMGKSYLVTFTEKGIKQVYEARMTRIGKWMFAEFMPYKIDLDEDPFGNYETGYSFARVEYNSNKIQLYFLNGDKIKSLVTSGKLKISYEYERLFDNFLITADTNEMRAFLEKYGGDAGLFNQQDVVTLTRQE